MYRMHTFGEWLIKLSPHLQKPHNYNLVWPERWPFRFVSLNTDLFTEVHFNLLLCVYLKNVFKTLQI